MKPLSELLNSGMTSMIAENKMATTLEMEHFMTGLHVTASGFVSYRANDRSLHSVALDEIKRNLHQCCKCASVIDLDARYYHVFGVVYAHDIENGETTSKVVSTVYCEPCGTKHGVSDEHLQFSYIELAEKDHEEMLAAMFETADSGDQKPC